MSASIANCRCVGCGRTDTRACPGGCYWIDVDRTKGTGLCSRCDDAAKDASILQAKIDTDAVRAIVAKANTGDKDAIRRLGFWSFTYLPSALDEINRLRDEVAKAGKAVTA